MELDELLTVKEGGAELDLRAYAPTQDSGA